MSGSSPDGVREPTVDRTFLLPDGRRIGFRVFGADLDEGCTTKGATDFTTSSARVVIALHGTPGSRLKYAPADRAARERGLTLVAVDRWGYGNTDVHPQPSLTNWAADVRALADGLHIDRFSVCGISGGGPFAAALAAELPERVTAAALVAPVGLIARPNAIGPAPSLDPMHAVIFRGLSRSPVLIRTVFRGFRGVLSLSSRAAIAMAMARNGPADRRLLKNSAVVDSLGRMMREGLRPGTIGPAIDLTIFGRPWDVRLGDIRAPTQVWFGDQDRNVPAAAIHALVEAIPPASLRRMTNQGHFWVATRFDEVLNWLQQNQRANERLSGPAPALKTSPLSE